MNKTEEIIVGLDIGSTKVCAVAGLRGEDGGVEVIGVSQCLSCDQHDSLDGNIDATATAILKAINEVERMAGCISVRLRRTLLEPHPLRLGFCLV